MRIAAPAAQQLERGRCWWIENRHKAPLAFTDELAELVACLEARPELVGRPVEQDASVRRVYLRRIRYYVYFEIAGDHSLVTVLAVWHASRGGEPAL